MGTIHHSIEIETPVDRVWQTIRDFHHMKWAPNVITDLQVVGDGPGDQVGAVRVLNGAFRETLLEFDDKNRTFAYSIDDGPSPLSKGEVKNYVGRVKISAAGGSGKTLVEWSSSWEENDEAVSEFCNGMYMALLGEMKKSME
jgi:hypothetical protein